jgi:hypothetical protein
MAEPNENRKITVSREFSVAAPQSERAYPIPSSEWERLKRAISRLAPQQNWYQAGGWLCAGVSITSFISIFGSDSLLSTNSPVVEWVAAISGGLLAAVLLYFDSQQRQSIAETAQNIVEDMSHIERMFVPDGPPAQAEALPAVDDKQLP